MIEVLGIHGPSQSGKDTVADYLVSNKGWAENISFAWNLKEMVKAVFFLTDHQLNSQEGKKSALAEPIEFSSRNLGSVMYWMSRSHPAARVKDESISKVKGLVGTKLHTPREVIQFVGTEVCRELVPSYHVDVLEIYLRSKQEGKFVISDIRFPDEAEMLINKFSGNVVKLERDNLADGVNRSHKSEVSMLGWDKFLDVIDNRKEGLDNLFSEVDNFLERNNLV